MMQACRIPLFQVPGITDTRDPSKSISLVQTPESKRAWYSSKRSRSKLPDIQPRLQLLYCDQSYSSAPIVVRSPSRSNVFSTKASTAQNDKTKYPIRNSPTLANHPQYPMLLQNKATDGGARHSNGVNNFTEIPKQNVGPVPAKPLLTGPPNDSVRSFVKNQYYTPNLSYPVQKGPCLKLINPREVLAYENKKRATTNQGFFQSIKWNNQAPCSKPIPPLPVMKVLAPPFEESKISVPVHKKQVSSTVEDVTPKSPPKKVTFSESHLKDSSTSPRQSDREEFHGLLSQAEIKHEFETAAAMHYLASVTKHQASEKPRTKEMAQQTEEVTEEDEIPRSLPPRSKHLPPPDIYLRLRFAKDAGLPLEDVADELKREKDFVNVADIDSKSVLEGIIQQKQADGRVSPLIGQNVGSSFVEREHKSQDWLSANSIIAEHLKEVTKSSSVKHSNKNNWSSAMQQMSSQLEAIDEMAQNMQKDFRDTERLVETIDTLTDVMAPSVDNTISTHVQPPKESEFVSRNLSPLLEVSYESRPKSPMSKRIISHSPPRTEIRPYHHVQQQKESSYSPPPQKKSPRKTSHKYDQYRNRMNNALQLAHESIDIESFDGDYGNIISEEAHSSLHSSVISLEQELSMISQQRHLSPVSSRHDFQDHSQIKLQDELDQLNESINAPEARVKHWKDRTRDEKASIRKWMAKKRRERTEKYKEELQRLQEREKRPFQPKENNINSTLTKQETSERRRADVDARLEEAMLLLNDLKTDQPNLPTEMDRTSSGGRKRGSTSPGKLYKKNLARKTPYQPLTPSRKYMTSSVRSGSSVGYSERNRKPPIGKSDNFSRIPISASGSFSDISGVSGWTMSDEVKALLYSTDASRKPYKGVTFDLGQRSKFDTSFNDLLPDNSVNLSDLGIKVDETIEDRASQNTESLIADVDWSDVERLVASVNFKDTHK